MNNLVLYFFIGIMIFVVIGLLRYLELINNFFFLVLTTIFIFFLYFLRKKLNINFWK